MFDLNNNILIENLKYITIFAQYIYLCNHLNKKLIKKNKKLNN